MIECEWKMPDGETVYLSWAMLQALQAIEKTFPKNRDGDGPKATEYRIPPGKWKPVTPKK